MSAEPSPAPTQRPAPPSAPSPAPAPTAPSPASLPAPAPGRARAAHDIPAGGLVPDPDPGRRQPSPAQSWPVTLTIRTLPALPHVEFRFDGRAVVTDGSGEASYTEPHNFDHHTLTLINTSIVT